MWFKKLKTPVNNEIKETDAVQMWEVRWRSRHGECSWDMRSEVEVFLSESDANAFAESLRAAYRLTRTTFGNYVEVKKHHKPKI